MIYGIVSTTDHFVNYGAIVDAINHKNQNILENFSYISVYGDHSTANSYAILAIILKFYFFVGILCSLLTGVCQSFRQESIFRWSTKSAIVNLAMFGAVFYALFGPAIFGVHTSRGGFPPNLFGLFLISHIAIIPSLFVFSFFPLLPSER